MSNEITYPQWEKATKTVRALQEQLRSVNFRQQVLEKKERTFYYGEELKMNQQIRELKSQNEN